MKILIAVDASDANHAIAAAARRLFPHDEHLVISAASVAPYMVTEPFTGGAFVMGAPSMEGLTAAEETADEAVHSAQQVLGDESATSLVEIGDPGQVICEQAAALFPLKLGRVHERPVGPHPDWSCQLAFKAGLFDQVVPWLILNRDGLVVFLHPLTGNDLLDHRDRAVWMGDIRPLDFSVLSEDAVEYDL